MTTQSWASRIRHDDTAGFREWGLELSTKLAAAGLVQTTDTGQINWTTVAKPVSNTIAGYEVWRMNDAMQATAPVFFKIEYGGAASANAPRLQITVGTATNGAGTLSGTALTIARTPHGGSVAQISDNSRQSYLCVTEGFFGLSWKIGSGTTESSFFFARTVDSTGTPNATGAMVIWGGGSVSNFTASQALRFAAPAAAYAAQASVANTALCFYPQTPVTSTLLNGDNQAFIAWTVTPAVEPLVGLCGIVSTEVAYGNTVTFTPVGTTAHTYLALPDFAGPAGVVGVSSAGGLRMCMLWE